MILQFCLFLFFMFPLISAIYPRIDNKFCLSGSAILFMSCSCMWIPSESYSLFTCNSNYNHNLDMICSTFCTFICDIYVMSFISLYFALISASTGRKIKSENCTRTNHVYKGSASKCRNRFPCAAFSQWNRNRQPNLAAAKSVETFVVPRFCSARDALASCALCRPISIPVVDPSPLCYTDTHCCCVPFMMTATAAAILCRLRIRVRGLSLLISMGNP